MGCTDRSLLRPLLGGARTRRLSRQNSNNNNNNNNDLELDSKGYHRFDNMEGSESKFRKKGGSTRIGLIGRRLFLLVYKNLLIRKRQYIVTAFEIILPTLCAMLIAYAKAKAGTELKQLETNLAGIAINNATIFPEYNETALITGTEFALNSHRAVLAYAPVTPLTEKVIRELKGKLTGLSDLEWKGFDNEVAIQVYQQRLDTETSQDTKKLEMAIIFQGGFEDEYSEFPKGHRFTYKLRFLDGPSDMDLFPKFQVPGPNKQNARLYEYTGFSGMQILVDKVLISLLTNQEVNDQIVLQPFPYPPYHGGFDFPLFFEKFIPLLLTAGFIFIVPSIIRGVVSEKETGIRELMKMMGLPSWMHWTGWLMNSMLVLIISTTIIIFSLFYAFNPESGAVVEHSDPLLWWIIFCLYCVASTCFCFFISSFFQRPTLGMTFGLILWLVTIFALAMNVDYNKLNTLEKMAMCLVPNVALTYSIRFLGAFEGKAVGSHWGNLFEPINTIDSFTISHIILMMILSSFVYIMLTLYIENVLPSAYGVRKPWYYIFKASTWCSQSSVSQSPITTSAGSERRSSFEAEPLGISPGVELYNLRKTFGRQKVAVDNVTLKIYDGQITALLGHNGAGKTTTMSMITGMFAPTSGTAVVNGYDISTDLEGARQNLGLCPQHNMLFDKLTVEEHLVLFGMLKGLTAAQAKADAKVLAKKLGFSDKLNKFAMSLSGGQKRKLNLGMALVGGSKIVILDEPTSGMDPEARRKIWDLLLDMRGQRTIILTTHFMEEADVLGDRIAIMAEGKVKCCGSPMFLKRYYGAGYTLSMSIDSGSKSDVILLTVQKYIENASFKSQYAPNSSEIAIVLPTLAANTTSKFPDMFADLEENKKELGIKNIGLSLTTIDEVFVKAGQMDNDNSVEEDSRDREWSPESQRANDSRRGELFEDKLAGLRLMKQQFYALVVKRILYTIRKRKLFLSQLIVPILLVIMTIRSSNDIREPAPPPPPLSMSLQEYKKSVTLYSTEDMELGKIYAGLVGSGAQKITNGTLIENLIESGETDTAKYREQFIVASEFASGKFKALFSTIPYHSSPLSLNLVSNTILKKLAPTQNYAIEVINHPLERYGALSSLDLASAQPLASKTVPVMFAVLLPIGLALLAASFIVFPVEEKLCKAKQLQLMTGVNPIVFWMSSLVWDYFVMLVLVCAMLTCFPIFETYSTYTAYNGGGVLFSVLSVYGFAAITMSYLLSLVVSTVGGGFAFVAIIHVLSGIILSIIVFSLDLTGIGELLEAATTIRYFARIFPTFGVSISVMRFTEIAVINSRCLAISQHVLDVLCNPNVTYDDPSVRSCCPNCQTDFPSSSCFKPQPYILWSEKKFNPVQALHLGEASETPGIGQELVFMFVMGLAFLAILIVVEFGVLKRILSRVFKSDNSIFTRNNQDEDVTTEINRVQDMVTSGNLFEDAIIVKDLSKSYGSFAAVSNISFGVHHGECFGLLGVNGAGKTTTFRMLTGDEIRSQGGAYTTMSSLENDRKRFLSNIGYCPQFDGIVGVLTGKEMLELFCRLRGVQGNKIHAEAAKWLSKLGLSGSANVQCQSYSGGMKRRLSAAMALIGDPPVVMLDEPTSGVDPVARRQFWKVITSVRESGQAVILTSHSMEECEALCSRLGIMVNGQLQCLGGVQHLKNKFAQGFSLIIKLKPAESPEVDTLSEQVIQSFQPCHLKDRHQNILHYQVLNTSLPWDVLFRVMETLRQKYEHIIEDYSVNETTLEEVFLSFARKQYPERQVHVPFLKKLVTCQCL